MPAPPRRAARKDSRSFGQPRPVCARQDTEPHLAFEEDVLLPDLHHRLGIATGVALDVPVGDMTATKASACARPRTRNPAALPARGTRRGFPLSIMTGGDRSVLQIQVSRQPRPNNKNQPCLLARKARASSLFDKRLEQLRQAACIVRAVDDARARALVKLRLGAQLTAEELEHVCGQRSERGARPGGVIQRSRSQTRGHNCSVTRVCTFKRQARHCHGATGTPARGRAGGCAAGLAPMARCSLAYTQEAVPELLRCPRCFPRSS